jgi:hypothetical protein
MTPSISRQFARWAVDLSYEDLPEEVVEKVKALVLFHLVAGVFGATDPHARRLIELVKGEEPRADGATVLGDGAKVTRGAAAMANCEIAHIAGLWDSYRMITHPGPVLIAVALANAELNHKSGREMIVALVAGYEFECRLADDFVPSTSAQGFRPAPIFSTMGAAMVAAKLLDLDEDQLVATIAIAASSASGLNEPGRIGADERAFHEPNAARQGVFAAQMGSLGHTKGSETAIEGDAGFYAAYAGSVNGELSYVFTGERRIDLASITEGLGSRYKLLTVMFRMYNTSGYNQPVIDLMTELVAEHHLQADEIEEVVIFMNYLETLYPSPEFPRFADPSVPRVGSTQFFCAHAAVNGGFPVVGGRTFGPTGEDLDDDQAVVEFMTDKVRLVGVHDQAMFSPEISVRMKAGRTISGVYPYARMEWMFDELVENLRRCLPGLPGGASRLDALVALVASMDDLDSVGPIVEEMCRAEEPKS